MTLMRRFRSLALLGMALTPLLLFAAQADSETDASPNDPWFLDFPSAVCDVLNNAYYHCPTHTCAQVITTSFDVHGDLTVDIKLGSFTLGGKLVGAQIPASAGFDGNGAGFVQCSTQKCSSICHSHGWGCGNFNFFLGPNCQFPLNSLDPSQSLSKVGWAHGCALHS